MHAPCDLHFHALKHILRYLKGTLDYWHTIVLRYLLLRALYLTLMLTGAGALILAALPLVIVCFLVIILYWSSKRQATLSQFSIDA